MSAFTRSWPRWALLVLASLVAWPVATPAAALDQEIAQRVRQKLAEQLERLDGYRAASDAQIQDVARDSKIELAIELSAGVTYAIVAACDGCTRVQLSLFGIDRRLLATSSEGIEIAIVGGAPTESGEHLVEVESPGCNAASCAVGVLLLFQAAPQRLAGLDARPAVPLSGDEITVVAAGDLFKECDACPEMVVVPAGEFTLGSPLNEEGRHSDEGPQIKASVVKPFAVGRFEITRDEYEAFLKQANREAIRGCRLWSARLKAWDLRTATTFRNPGFQQNGKHPVVCVSWDDAQAYLTWLSQATGARYRLLSEAEWEYVARAGTSTPFWWGSTISTDQANYDGQVAYGTGSKGPWRQATVPVDSFAPNPWGLYNVHGNVWEWVEDCYSVETYKAIAKAAQTNRPQPEQTCPPDGRAFRGGSWLDDPDYLRSARRVWHRPGGRYNYLGFRVARTL